MLKSNTFKTTFKQELTEKLEAIGRLDALLINPPEAFTENNPNLEKSLSGYYVFCGLVPPGKHTLIIEHGKNFYFRNMLVDGCKYDVLPVVV